MRQDFSKQKYAVSLSAYALGACFSHAVNNIII